MSLARIVIVQDDFDGVAGRARDDLVLSLPVTLRNEIDDGVQSWRWTMVSRPRGSTATLSGAQSPEAEFTPDVEGSYLVQLSVDQGRTGQVQRTVCAVRTAFGGEDVRIPAAAETNEANWLLAGVPNSTGWWDDMELLLRTLIANSGGGGGVTDHGALTGLADDDHTQYALAGAVGSSRLTQATARLLGRTTAAAGAPEEISVSSPLTLAGLALGLDQTNINVGDISRTLYSYDWTTLPSTVDGGGTPINFADGAVVLGDRTWTCVNQAAGALWRMTNGTGLQWQGATGSSVSIGFTVGAQTGALIYITLVDLLGARYDPLRRYVVEVQFSGYVNANSCRLYVGFWNPTNTTARLAGRRGDGVPSPNTTSLRDGGTVSGQSAPVGDLLGIQADNSGFMHILDGAWPTGEVVLSTTSTPTAGQAPFTRDTRLLISSSYARSGAVTAAWNISQIRVREV